MVGYLRVRKGINICFKPFLMWATSLPDFLKASEVINPVDVANFRKLVPEKHAQRDLWLNVLFKVEKTKFCLTVQIATQVYIDYSNAYSVSRYF